MGSVLEREPAPPDLRVPYGPHPATFGDLRLPTGAGPYPVLIAIHGGYWRARYDLTYMGHLCAALTAAGFATWNIEYRRVGQEGGGWPGTFLDVSAAADALRSLAPAYDLDPDRVVVLGHSAGGHLALWLAARRRLPAGSPVTTPDPLPLTAVVALAPVADPRRAYRWGLSDRAAAELLGGAPEAVPERYNLGSPEWLLPLGVPQVLLHGREDEAVPYEMSVQYVDAAQEAGDLAQLIPLECGHFEPVDPASDVWPLVLTTVSRLAYGSL